MTVRRFSPMFVAQNIQQLLLSPRHVRKAGPSVSSLQFHLNGRKHIWTISRKSALESNKSISKDSLYFITTPIFYVNAVPHVGHLYTAVLSDAISRWQAMKGSRVIFSTGTDEHGLKIQQAAMKANKSPLEFCDAVSASFKELFKAANIANTDYIRTTEEKHKLTVQYFWKVLEEKGQLYKGDYEGYYCMADEAFLTSDQVEQVHNPDGSVKMVSAESGHPVEWMKETNYMFRLSEYKDKLTEWLDRGVIYPNVHEPKVRQYVESLQDLSVSRERSRLQWGIPVPGDETQTIYVWLDALVNYLTVAGYPNTDFHWPADCQVVGKDILKFHAVYWPAFLMAAGLEPPRRILCHSHWLVDNRKMSKSIGNVIDPWEQLSLFGVDGIRYFLLRDGVPHNDGNYGEMKVLKYVNAELGNTLGNLINRCSSPTVNPSLMFPAFQEQPFMEHASDADKQMLQDLLTLPDAVEKEYENYNIYKAINLVMSQLRETNRFVNDHKPWELAKSSELISKEWHSSMLAVVFETLRMSSILLSPVVPKISEKLQRKLGVPGEMCTLQCIRNLTLEGLAMRSATNLGQSKELIYQNVNKKVLEQKQNHKVKQTKQIN